MKALSAKNRLSTCENHKPEDVKKYGPYFLGSIVICEKESGNYIIDGQQRLTSVTLLLIYLNNLQKELEEKVSLDYLIFSESFRKKSFNLEVEERESCMTALYNNESFDISDQTESVKNLFQRYEDIKENFPEELKQTSLPFFIDWVLNRVEMLVPCFFAQSSQRFFCATDGK
jgi:uncharacterized protein with ParB-like and HNH nuclease domain